ncbi:MAG: carboxymuconolactone decarboxylase family protein [Myxococcota bacterium]
MTTPRLPMLSLEEAAAAARKLEIPAQIAELNIFRVLLAHPELAKRVNDLLLTLLLRGRLDARLRELVIMRLGWATGCEYEWAQHWRIALQLGLGEADLLAVRDWRDSDVLSDADKAVLAATDEVLADGAVSPETWARCASLVGGAEALLELVAAIGTWRMISVVLRTLEIPLEDGVESWPPDGLSGGP